ncbi:MAG TPA: mannose-1-phosphate guanylyltransferase [Candidatus Limnocylindrales bacterium]|nr:mannose-1-phosphate guanylyltransferase [Candidatus Limnocylindrales bacterium]
MSKNRFYPVILAGGSGTRFWPRSRRRLAKQVLALDGNQTMIQTTVERLLPLGKENSFWIVTNSFVSAEIERQLPGVPPEQIVVEPEARNTAPAIGLAAFLLERSDPDAVIGMFPADHVIANEERFRTVMERAIEIASQPGNIVVMGVLPTRPETGYGYIETGDRLSSDLFRVRRFTEKPNLEKAEEFVAAGNYYWNSGMFVWSARTLTQALREHLSETAPYLEEIAAAWGTRAFHEKFAELYPKCENISIDYAVLEPRSAKGEHSSNLFCLRADFGWNDLGSWAALYEHHALSRQDEGHNVVEATALYAINATGNYIYAPEKFVAAVGVDNLVVVETEDAILVTTRQHSQDVGKIVKYLKEKKMTELV